MYMGTLNQQPLDLNACFDSMIRKFKDETNHSFYKNARLQEYKTYFRYFEKEHRQTTIYSPLEHEQYSFYYQGKIYKIIRLEYGDYQKKSDWLLEGELLNYYIFGSLDYGEVLGFSEDEITFFQKFMEHLNLTVVLRSLQLKK